MLKLNSVFFSVLFHQAASRHFACLVCLFSNLGHILLYYIVILISARSCALFLKLDVSYILLKVLRYLVLLFCSLNLFYGVILHFYFPY